jgi:hypothetical protein
VNVAGVARAQEAADRVGARGGRVAVVRTRRALGSIRARDAIAGVPGVARAFMVAYRIDARRMNRTTIRPSNTLVNVGASVCSDCFEDIPVATRTDKAKAI